LQGFTRVRLEPGEKQAVEFTLAEGQMSFADESGRWVLEPGEFQAWVGGNQPDPESAAQPENILTGRFTVPT
jgi:hypothetical protein